MAASGEQSPYFRDRLAKGDLIVKDAPKFDLESYIANYEGYTRVRRLQYVASLCPPLAVEALRLGIPEVKNGKDVDAYMRLTELASAILPESELSVTDEEWLTRRQKENQRETERLEHELRGYKNNLIKESIRMGQEDLATHYLSMADFEDSQKSFQKMREFCTTPKHIAEMTTKLIFATIASGQWIITQSNCHKARVLTLKNEDEEKMTPIIEACSGLAYLGVEDLRNAANTFLKVNPSFTTGQTVAGITFSRAVMTGNDIAVYGGLCALASMDRDELRTKVLDNAQFRNFLELEPHIRRSISLFCDGKYSQCLETLEAYRNDYLLDIYLGNSVSNIYRRIRSKSIVQYFVPFSHVTLSSLAAFFPRPDQAVTTTQMIEEELVEMIQTGQLNARIDTVDGLLVAPPKDVRAEAHKGVLDTAQDVEHTLRLKLHKMNMAQAGLVLRDTKAGKSARVGGAGQWEPGSALA